MAASSSGAILVESPDATQSTRQLPLGAIAVLAIVVAFAVTRPEVQHASRIGLGVAGFVPLATTLRGTVTDEAGDPVAHADVTIEQAAPVTRSTADRLGTYAIAFDVMANRPTVVSVSAIGYETHVREIGIRSSEVTYDAHLHRVVRIGAGAEVRLSIAPDDGLCRVALDVWPCRIVHLTALHSGRVAAVVIPDDPQVNLGVRLSVPRRIFADTPALSSDCCASRAELMVPEGTDVTVEILYLDFANVTAPASSARTGFTLRSSE
jgi:hypothetical protein